MYVPVLVCFMWFRSLVLVCCVVLREIWPAVTKVERCNEEGMLLDVGGVACVVTYEHNPSFLWNVDHLAASAKAGLQMFLCVLRAENLTTCRAAAVAVDDSLEVGHVVRLRPAAGPPLARLCLYFRQCGASGFATIRGGL